MAKKPGAGKRISDFEKLRLSTADAHRELDPAPIGAKFSEIIRWEESDMELREFMNTYERALPQFIRVTQGCITADKKFVFSSGDEFWLYNVYRLPRVIATTMDGVYVSIPRNYNQRFVIVNSTGERSQPMNMRTIVDMWQSSGVSDIEVELENNASVLLLTNQNEMTTTQLGKMIIEDIHDEKYFLGRSVLHDGLYPSVTLIPMFAQINVSVAAGRSTADAESLAGLLHLAQACHETLPPPILDHDAVSKEIMQMPEDYSGGDYIYVEPIDATVLPSQSSSSPLSPGNSNPLLQPPPPRPNSRSNHQLNPNPNYKNSRISLPEFPPQSPLDLDPKAKHRFTAISLPSTSIASRRESTSSSSSSEDKPSSIGRQSGTKHPPPPVLSPPRRQSTSSNEDKSIAPLASPAGVGLRGKPPPPPPPTDDAVTASAIYKTPSLITSASSVALSKRSPLPLPKPAFDENAPKHYQSAIALSSLDSDKHASSSQMNHFHLQRYPSMAPDVAVLAYQGNKQQQGQQQYPNKRSSGIHNIRQLYGAPTPVASSLSVDAVTDKQPSSPPTPTPPLSVYSKSYNSSGSSSNSGTNSISTTSPTTKSNPLISAAADVNIVDGGASSKVFQATSSVNSTSEINPPSLRPPFLSMAEELKLKTEHRRASMQGIVGGSSSDSNSINSSRAPDSPHSQSNTGQGQRQGQVHWRPQSEHIANNSQSVGGRPNTSGGFVSHDNARQRTMSAVEETLCHDGKETGDDVVTTKRPLLPHLQILTLPAKPVADTTYDDVKSVSSNQQQQQHARSSPPSAAAGRSNNNSLWKNDVIPPAVGKQSQFPPRRAFEDTPSSSTPAFSMPVLRPAAAKSRLLQKEADVTPDAPSVPAALASASNNNKIIKSSSSGQIGCITSSAAAARTSVGGSSSAFHLQGNKKAFAGERFTQKNSSCCSNSSDSDGDYDDVTNAPLNSPPSAMTSPRVTGPATSPATEPSLSAEPATQLMTSSTGVAGLAAAFGRVNNKKISQTTQPIESMSKPAVTTTGATTATAAAPIANSVTNLAGSAKPPLVSSPSARTSFPVYTKPSINVINGNHQQDNARKLQPAHNGNNSRISSSTFHLNAESSTSRNSESTAVFNSLTDVPKELKSLTIAQVANVVRLLFPLKPGLSDLVLQEGIDGALLVELEPNELTSAGFNGVEAKKLVKFVRDSAPNMA